VVLITLVLQLTLVLLRYYISYIFDIHAGRSTSPIHNKLYSNKLYKLYKLYSNKP